jgi:amicyanin
MSEETQTAVRRRRGVKVFGIGTVFAAGAILLAACGGGYGQSASAAPNMNMAAMTSVPAQPGAAVATSAVAIKNFAFSPATITVKAGATVVWTNNDAVDHTVTFDGGSISSSDLGTNDTFSHTFLTPGTYHYICTIHPFMHGTVIVTG